MPGCQFCDAVLKELTRPFLAETVTVVAFEDAFPSTPGHVLVIPRRHIGRVLELSEPEFRDLWFVARGQMRRLERDNHTGYTIGINDGQSAGQTVPHVHLHVIPRNSGDTQSARGGVRWAVPETAKYWS